MSLLKNITYFIILQSKKKKKDEPLVDSGLVQKYARGEKARTKVSRITWSK